MHIYILTHGQIFQMFSKEVLGANCDVKFSNVVAGHRERLCPILQGPLHEVWKPEIDLKKVPKLHVLDAEPNLCCAIQK